MKKGATTKGETPSRLIDARIKELNDWRGKTLSHVRALIKQADPEVVESGSGEAFRSGLTMASSAPARRTRASSS
jgi:hypothetical protein